MAAERPAASEGRGGFADRFPALRRLGWLDRSRIPFIQQLSEVECGPACLAMVLGYHGHRAALEEVRALCGATRDGTTAAALLDASSHLGLRGRGVKVDLEQLALLPVGSTILHWEFQHFVVLAGVDPRWVEIVDPAVGPRKVPIDEVRRAFTGVALTFEPNELFQKQRRGGALLGAMKSVMVGSGLLPSILITSLMLQLFGLALPVMMGQMVDRILPRGDLNLMAVLLIGSGIVILFEAAGEVLRGHLLLHLRTVLDTRLTLGFLEHLVGLPYSYFQVRGAGDLMMRLNSNTFVREHLTSGALSAILDGLLVVVYLAVLLLGSTAMAVATLLAGAVDVAIYLTVRRRQRELTASGLHAEARSQSYQVEMLTSIEMLKATGNEQRAVTHWSNLFVDSLNVVLDRERLAIKTDALLRARTAAAPLVVMAVGAVQVLEGRLTLGVMLALAAVAAGFHAPLTSLVHTAMSLESVRAYLERVNEVLAAAPEQDRRKTRQAPRLSGRISIEQVSFRYGDKSPLVVRDVSLEIHPGQFVAIVGRTGSGKSTLANLLMGLYPPTAGQIHFDGLDLATLELRSVRQQLGVVNQSFPLFGTTIRDNIALADASLPLEAVVAAARLASIDADIKAMPMGYNTMLVERGGSISGGQRQRMALARALVRRPSILLLDEATSALDAVTESEIQRSLETLESTRIVIAHRLSTIARADLIVVMDQGQVVETGTHQSLLRAGGPYARLVASQLGAPA
jgi:ATP-binding cassette subfamily B protein